MTAEVLVVGAGISGIGVGIELEKRGRDSYLLLERSEELGGTWRDNTYPGIAVDIPSSSYCFSFETDYPWSRAFAEGHEIQAYVRHCARKYGVDRHIRYGSTVRRATWDGSQWAVELDDGEVLTARFLIAATGLFTTPVLPDIEGLGDFDGTAFHTARWDHGADLSGRVGIIGTGATAVQVVPRIAESAGHLTVFQRTPIYVSPRPDYPLTWAPHRRLGAIRKLLRWQSEAQIELLTFATAAYSRMPWLVHGVQRAVLAWMASQVEDPATRAKLLPTYALGCKRPTPSNTYLKAFNRPNVSLVTDPIERISESGVVAGELHELDALILATGFETTEQGNAPAFQVVGRDGVELGQFWEDHRLQAYQGVAVPGFPNFFLTAGPYSGGFNWFSALEAHLGVVLDCLERAWDLGDVVVEVRSEAHDAWMERMWSYAEGTVFKASACAGANSYYIDRHGDASLPLPRTPWWRIAEFRRLGSSGFEFR